jgi:hypothetical protein
MRHNHLLKRLFVALVSMVAMLAAVGPPVSAAIAPTDFVLSATPVRLRMTAGSSRSIRIRVKRGTKFKSPLTFSVQNPFAGVSADVEAVTAKGSTLIIGIDTNVNSQVGPVQVIATGGGITKAVAITLTVNGKGTPQAVGAAPPVTAAAPATSPPATTPPAAVTLPPSTPAPPKPTVLKTTPNTNPAPVTPAQTTAVPANVAALTDVIYSVSTGGNGSLDFYVGVNQGNGVFSPVKTNLTAPYRVADWAVGDVNGDGFDDVIFQIYAGIDTCEIAYQVALRKSASEFAFPDGRIVGGHSCFYETEPSGTKTQSWNGFAVGDLNGDKRADIAAISGAEGYNADGEPRWEVVALFGDGTAGTGNGRTGFVVTRVKYLEPDAAPFFLRVIDNNGDGRAEIALFGRRGPTGALFSGWQLFRVDNAGVATLQTETRGPQPSQAVATDLNANGKQELFTKIATDTSTIMFMKDGGGVFYSPGRYLVGGGNLNGDSIPDLLTFSGNPGKFRILTSDGASPPKLTPADSLSVAIIEKAKTGQFG